MAFVIAYDAARHACAGLLAQQGLRAKSDSHHQTVQHAVADQFDGPFSDFGALRRRRNELEYPAGPEDEETGASATASIERAAKIVEAAEQLLPRLGFFAR